MKREQHNLTIANTALRAKMALCFLFLFFFLQLLSAFSYPTRVSLGVKYDKMHISHMWVYTKLRFCSLFTLRFTNGNRCVRTGCFLLRLWHKVKGINVSQKYFPFCLHTLPTRAVCFFLSGASKCCCQQLVSVCNPYSWLTWHVTLRLVRNPL